MSYWENAMSNSEPELELNFWLRRLGVIAEAVFASDHALLDSQRLRWLLAEIKDFTERAGPRARFVIVLSTLAVSVLAPLLSRRFCSLLKFAPRERIRALERLEASALCAPLIAVKALLAVIYYEHPDAQRDVGFDAACLLPETHTS
jgi:hypothetical protein